MVAAIILGSALAFALNWFDAVDIELLNDITDVPRSLPRPQLPWLGIVPQLIAYGRVKRAGLGISILPDAYARQWGISGVIVREVGRTSPAERAGLRSLRLDQRGNIASFDIIKGIENEVIESYDDLYQALDGRKPGATVTVHFEREGRTQKTSMRLQELQ